ncbi:putative ABC transporter permease subunit [Verrucomicrobiota bacterium sgz303538]
MAPGDAPVEIIIMESPDPPPLSTARFFRTLVWAHWRALLARTRGLRHESPLLIFVLAALVLGYIAVGYWLFHQGLNYLYHFPLVGSLLSQRILFLIFGFFFMMLMFSNLIIGYSTLFRNRETMWFLSLPIPHRNVYRWKFLEALVVSSWALIFLSAPMMIAYGQVHGVSPAFYLQIALVYLPFVVIPAVFGSSAIVFLVRVIAKPWVKRLTLAVAVTIVVALVLGIKPVSEAEAVSSQEVLTFDQLLRHTRVSVSPYLPSAWLAQSVLAWSEGLSRQGTFFFLLLLSNALMALLIGFEWVGRCYYGSWVAALSSRAERFQRKAESKRMRGHRRTLLEHSLDILRPISRPGAALTLKDIRLFWRDPAQWIQFMIFFGLLCIYVVNLRNVAFNFQNPFWETMISYLNLAASALTLSTLTTRFVYPQFSLEGRRLWIIGLAPVGLQRVLLQKFLLSCFVALAITVTLMIVSSIMLHLTWTKVAFFAVAIALMSAALSGLAVGLGAIFPNFKEDNPSKIVSGFGGTLCLVISFIYITVFVSLIALPDVRRVTNIDLPLPDALILALAVVFSLCVLFFPLATAWQRVKRLEI